MSKSKLTAIAPERDHRHFGSDAFRYYFLRTIAFGSDGTFSWEHLTARLHLRARQRPRQPGVAGSTAMVGKYFDGVLPEPTDDGPAEQALADALAADRRDRRRGDRATLALPRGAGAIDDFVGAVNGYVTEQEPWKVAKDDTEQAGRGWRRSCTPRPRRCARRRTAQPGDAEDAAGCGTLLGAEASRPPRRPARPGRRRLGPAPRRRRR